MGEKVVFRALFNLMSIGLTRQMKMEAILSREGKWREGGMCGPATTGITGRAVPSVLHAVVFAVEDRCARKSAELARGLRLGEEEERSYGQKRQSKSDG